MNLNYEEFLKVIEVTKMDKDMKKKIIKHSKVFFDFQEYMMEKHNISVDAVESMSSAYIQSRLTPDSDNELFERFMSGDNSVLSELYQQFANEQGFNESIVESMELFMNLYIK